MQVTRASWPELQIGLAENLKEIEKWSPDTPAPAVARCEISRHRTLAHLRACQEQWLEVLIQFQELDQPSVKILHPWRHFEAKGYDLVDWDQHMQHFIAGRHEWLTRCRTADPDRGGRWNRRVDTIEGLTRRLCEHESHHIATLKA